MGSVSSLVSEKKIFEISANQSILLALAAILNIRLERKNSNFAEDHPRNIPAKFGSNRPSGFGEEAWNVKRFTDDRRQTTDNRRQTTDDGRQVMAIVHLDLWSRWTKNIYPGLSSQIDKPWFITAFLRFWKLQKTWIISYKPGIELKMSISLEQA